jgi:hypothetical protein
MGTEQMARYHFRLCTKDFAVIDEEGNEFDSFHDAMEHAITVAGELARNDDSPEGKVLSVIAEGGSIVFAIAINEVRGPKIYENHESSVFAHKRPRPFAALGNQTGSGRRSDEKAVRVVFISLDSITRLRGDPTHQTS